MAYCSLCDNTGWMAILVDGVRRMTRCTHLAAEKAEREKARPGGFTAIKDIAAGLGVRDTGHERAVGSPESLSPTIEELLAQRPILSDLLSREDLVVAKLIQVHVGKASAIRIKDLIAALGESWNDRDVKNSIEKLRTLAGMPIVGSKEPPYGLFLPATAAECDEAFDRYVREGIKLFMIARLVKPSANLVQHLRGQLELTEAR
jgi:hypothetical protein